MAAAGADSALLSSGDQEAFDTAMANASDTYRVAVVTADTTRDVAVATAENGYAHAVKGVNGADKAWQNAVDLAIRNFDVAESNAYATKLVDLADADADYRTDSAAGFAAAMADLSIDHPSPWANLAADLAAAEADLVADVAAADAQKAASEANAARDLEVAEADAELLKSSLKALATATLADATADAKLLLVETQAAAKVVGAIAGVFGPDASGPLPSAGQQGEPSVRQQPEVETEGSYVQSPSYFSQQGGSADTHTWHPYDNYYGDYEQVDPFEHWSDDGGSNVFELLDAMGLDAEVYESLMAIAAAPVTVSMPSGGPWKCGLSSGTSGGGTGASPAETPMAAPAATPTGAAVPVEIIGAGEAAARRQKELLSSWANQMMATTPVEQWLAEVDKLLGMLAKNGTPLDPELAKQLRDWIAEMQAGALQGKEYADAIAGAGDSSSGEEELPSDVEGLLLDVVQFALDIAGFFEPTPFCDGASGVISLLRGDWLGAGTSLVSFIPYVGDAAKLTRIAKYVRSVENAIELAAKSEKYADKLQPVLKQLHELLKRVPLEKLPDSVQGPLKTLKGKLDELFDGAGALPSPRSSLLNEASDPRLRNAIDNLYRPNAKIGSGSSMDAVRFEKATGQLLSPTGHIQKLLDRRTQLMKLLSDPKLSANDRAIVKRLLIDIQDALSR